MKKGLFALAVCGCLMVGSISAFATTTAYESQVSGGWSELTGYFTNNDRGSTYSIVATSNTPTHTASQERRSAGASVTERRVIAHTVWDNTYHYSRARFEDFFSGNAYADSGRVFGYDETEAYSGWRDTNLSFEIAKTYYGTE